MATTNTQNNTHNSEHWKPFDRFSFLSTVIIATMTAVQQAKRNDQRTRRKVYSVSKRGRTSKTKGWLRRRHEMNQRREREVLEEPLPSERIIIGPLCEHAMKMETQHLIEDYGGHQCSILDIVTAIMLSQRVSSLYAAQAMDEQKPFSSKGYKEVNKRYELSKRLGSLRTLSSSASTRTNKWEDVKDILKEHLSFEDAQEIVLPEAEAPLDVILAKNVRRMRLITLESLVMSDRSPTWALWRGITEAVIPSFKAALKSDKEQESELEETRASYDELIKSTIVSDVAERLDREEREREARESMAKLMRPLDDDEMAIVKQAIFGMGPGTEILAESETEQVQRQSIRRLAPGQWLNDEVISFFLYTLTKRDQEMCKQEPSRKRSHFFKSFFITKLFDEGNNDPAKDGVYNYKNVKRWSKKVPGTLNS